MKDKKELLNVINNNSKWPLIIEGATKKNFPNAVIISANIASCDLGIIPTENGLKFPIWVEELKEKFTETNHVLLCIDGLDDISQEEQEKFYGILKYKGLNGYTFPNGTQIIIPIKTNADKISKKIKSLCNIYKLTDLKI